MTQRSPIAWWAEQAWWEDPKYTEWLKCPANDLHQAAECMKQWFDRAWWNDLIKSPRNHSVAAGLVGQGLMPANFILELGSSLHRLRDCVGIRSKIRELREGSKADGVLFEVEVASDLHRQLLSIRFAPEGGRPSPDIIATTDAGEVEIECKRLGRREIDQWTSDLMSIATHDLPHDIGFGFNVVLAPDLTFLRMTGRDVPPNWNAAVAVSLGVQVRRAIAAALHASPIPDRIEVPGIAEIIVVPGNSGRGSVEGGQHSFAADVRRVVEHVFEACGKFTPGTPGILTVQCDFLPGEALVRAAIDAAVKVAPSASGTDRLAGIVLIPRVAVIPGLKPMAIRTAAFSGRDDVELVMRALCECRRADRWAAMWR